MRARLRPLLLAALAVAAVSCSATPDGEEGDAATEQAEQIEALRDEVDALRDEGDEVAAEVVELREALGGDDGDDEAAPDPFADVTARLDDLDEQVAELGSSRATVTEAQEAAQGAADDAASDLRATLDDVRAATEQVRGEVEQLRTLYEVLRERVDRIDERT